MSSPSSLNKEEQSTTSDDRNSIKKWECLKNWIHCICVVAFDLELGQAIEVFNFHINYHLSVFDTLP